LGSARLAGELDEAFSLATEVADAHPDSREAQFLAAEIAYRSSRWTEAAAYFRRGGDPGDEQPVLLFFKAVSLYESGDRAGAAQALKRSLPLIQRSDYVDRYAEEILGEEGAAGDVKNR
ncbi:MAG: tetratricopeptide repeat protein, partial [Acidobacteria bacterium]|nr:tetratricopeptide repeat protein [Acidobacteriota bacterium]